MKNFGIEFYFLESMLYKIPHLSFKMLFFMSLAIFSSESCKNNSVKTEQASSKKRLFRLLPQKKTHIGFKNTLSEGLNRNILMYEGFYNGGGVAIGDMNNDGLSDIYFTGNIVSNRLYLNEGNMHFKDVTTQAGVGGKIGPWTTGVTMVDINGDGLLDIYVCRSGNMAKKSKRTNKLFINQGVDSSGIPHFKQEAAKYGLASPGFSTQAAFFDYDHDGDLDMLLVNRNVSRLNINQATIPKLTNDDDPYNGIRMFKNIKGHFKDVTENTGIKSITLTSGLGVSIADLNKDGWPDIYIGNDYATPDYLYINNGDGTFSDRIGSMLRHTSKSSMGNDISDINNDGYPDIFTADMMPASNHRQKLLYDPSFSNYKKFNFLVRSGFHAQYTRNMLQLNNGNGTFSEIGQLSGVSNTAWSWAPLFADFNNNGWKDLYVTNGFLRDYTNMDFLKLLRKKLHQWSPHVTRKELYSLISKMPKTKLTNYIFKNNGNLTFTNEGSEWGINKASNGNGAAYADLDNDGDLDLVVNNINQPAFIYENKENKRDKNHYLEIKLQGDNKNTNGIGAKVSIYYNSKHQYLGQMPTRGFQSSVSSVLHFGTGNAMIIDSLQVIWPTGKKQVLKNVKVNQRLTLKESDAVHHYNKPEAKQAKAKIFAKQKSPVNFHHLNKNNADFKRQPLMVNAQSPVGPPLGKADVNGDGLEDVYVGGGKEQSGQLFIQQRNGQFIVENPSMFIGAKESNDADAVFFDANGDGLPDLYVCSGGYNDYNPHSLLLQDRLYINEGDGKFVKSKNALPQMYTSTSCVAVADINGDGLPDLLVGGRVIPGQYPKIPRSYILINQGNGKFKDETSKIAPKLRGIGMVTDAQWVDLNGDHKKDLIVIGEWMPITIFTNRNGKLINETKKYFKKKYRGWWNTIYTGDLNGDGKIDIVAGNHGLNSQVKVSRTEPAELYYKDFNGDGIVDPIFCFYIQGTSYPFVTRDQLIKQLPKMKSKFPTYKSYADATIHDIFSENEMKGAKRLKANYLKTAYFVQDSTGRFQFKSLPIEAQFSPVYNISPLDFNGDHYTDLLLTGNMNRARLRLGEYDANYGVLLENSKNGEFKYVPQGKSGFNLKGDVRDVLKIDSLLIFGINKKGIKVYKNTMKH